MQVSVKEAKSLASNTGMLVAGDESQQSMSVLETADPRVRGMCSRYRLNRLCSTLALVDCMIKQEQLQVCAAQAEPVAVVQRKLTRKAATQSAGQPLSGVKLLT